VRKTCSTQGGGVRNLVRNVKETVNLSELGTGGRILKWVLKPYGMKLRTGFSWPGQDPVAGCYEYGNEHSVSIRGR
jgi:hypothetical protein